MINFVKTQRLFISHFNVGLYENVPIRKTIANWVSLSRNMAQAQNKTPKRTKKVRAPEKNGRKQELVTSESKEAC